MSRITEKQLQAVVDRINRLTNSPMTPYLDGKPQANCYHLSHAYGGVALHRMSDREGCTGVSDMFGYHMPKRDLFNRMQAFIAGLEASKC